MEKQDLIKEINKEKYDFSKPETSLNSSDYKEGYNDACDDILDIIFKQLDEPQKVKVPAFMKEFLDFCNKHEQNGLEAYHGLFNICSSWPKDDILQWSFEDPYRFINAFQYGYEVEDAAEWVVRVKEMYFLNWGEDGTCPTFVIDDCPGAKLQAKTFIKSEAQALAVSLKGAIEKV
ncbi:MULTISPECIES: DUF1642 domain-containing protein [Enterococcus]|jgi:predicted TIM-barrel fold metal-dependent hydrolase|uniref:DUF1642 domain-containing protein n=1 Tax=Enterococcus TaxID=1350 RepID=UPI0008A31BC1|nr:DUF1642 domain-containing protein [Enterococcus sp. HMSC072H05]OFL87303.1 hypothetical protein HMPREF2742_17090 [Enterococcus sp. HMSC072H05]